MKKYTILSLIVISVCAATLATWGQRGSSRRERGEKRREMQKQAIVQIEEYTAKLKADMEKAAQATHDRSGSQSLSEEEKNKRRETWRKQREERQKIVADIESQVAILKGSRQLSKENDAVLAELEAIRDLATEEKAEKTAKHLSELINKKQKSFAQSLKKLGFEE